MISKFKKFYYIAIVAAVLLLSVDMSAQTQPYRVSDSNVQNLINRIESRTNTYRESVYKALDNSNINGTQREDGINSYVKDFENATDSLKNNFNNRRSTTNDVREVLDRAVLINRFMSNNSLNRTTQNQWKAIRNDLNTLTNYYRMSWNWNGQNNQTYPSNPYRVSDSSVQNLINRIETRTNTYRESVYKALDKSNINGSQREDGINSYVKDFENATDSLKENFKNRRSTTNDVQEVLNRAILINRFMSNNSLNRTTQNQWKAIRSDLNTLTNYYSMSWNWNNQNYPNNQNNSFDSRLTGTYRLNTRLSESAPEMISAAISRINYTNDQRERTQRNLERRMISSEMIMIEKRGNEITLASSNLPQVSFTADGVKHSETSNNGRTISVSATSTYNDVSINYEGDRMNDFYVSFTPINNNQLRITRRVYLENRNETITVASIYDKTDSNPLWNTVTYPNNSAGVNSDNFAIPNNTRLTATLNSPLSTKNSRNEDQFSMTVTSPSQYSGAVIQGRVIGERSGVVSGRATLNLNFDSIRMPNGNTYRFAGFVEEVRTENGKKIDVNNEGTVRDGSQATKTVTRAGIGAVIGAIIGAIADGGSGAAIGAGIGAGAGAGSVILQGRDNLELGTGSEFTITATAPNNVANNR